MRRIPDFEDCPAPHGGTHREHLGGVVFERTTWPIGPPGVASRNVFLLITRYGDDAMTISIAGVTRLDPPSGD
jgi:hypothetical protein